MARAIAPLPPVKLCRPRMPRALARPRLFAALDRALEGGGVWIAARPGAGKTTLISTYLDARKRNSLWYQVDARDIDPANVFHHLAQAAARPAARSRIALPAFTPDARRDLDGFARRFFASLYASWLAPQALVFDNLHEAASPELHRVLAAALAEAPSGITLIFSGRDDIPAELVGAQASRALSTFDADTLTVTADEAVALSEIVGARDRAMALAIHHRVNGWAAGIVLLANARSDDGRTIGDQHGTGQLFDYFAAEVFDRLDGPTQRVLLTTALLPNFSPAMAKAISGAPGAERAIERCYRRHLFVERRDVRASPGDHERRYQYHPLFAAFLRAKAEKSIAPDALAAWRRHAIALMAQSGQADAAIATCLDLGELATAVALLLHEAPQMLRSGRHRQLHAWILDADPDRRDPWLRYWSGVAHTHTDQRQARVTLREAFDAFATGNDMHGQLLAAAAMLDAIHSAWSTFEALEEWLLIAEHLYRALPEPPDAATELRVLTGIVSGVWLLRPGDPRLVADVERLFALIDQDGDVNDRMAASLCLLPLTEALEHVEWRPRLERMVEQLLRQTELTPRKRAEWYFMADLNREASGGAGLIAAREIAWAHGFHDLLSRIACNRATAMLAIGQDLTAAEDLLREAERWLDPTRPFAVQEYHGVRARLAALLHRDGDAVLAHSELAIAAAQRARAPAPLMTFARQLLPTGHVLRGDFAAAIAEAEAIAKVAFPSHAETHRMVAEMIRAYQALVERRDDRDAVLKRALGKARELDRWLFFQSLRSEASLLCAAALNAGIEVEFVTRAIRQRKLKPPSLSIAAWPWPVRIHAFGALAIERDGVPLAFTGKAQKKPLELVKALVAAGGRPTNVAHLAAILWPDAEGDAAATALTVNLHRARKLLGHDEALGLYDGRLSFNSEWVWLDLRAFEGCVADIDAARDDDAEGKLADASARLLALYRGPLLKDDGDAAWLLPARVRCRDALLRAVARAGRWHEKRSRWRDAIALYQRGLDAEPLAEELYRALMRCHAAQRQIPDAVLAYRRCREMLSILLGVKPSAATEDLMREIHARR